jgi:hypothetical protein
MSTETGTSLIWDSEGRYREQSWEQFTYRLKRTHGGMGIAAADFIELLAYKPAPFRDKTWTQRQAYTELTSGANSPSDFSLIAQICDLMITEHRDLEAAWALVRLRDFEDTLDAKRVGLALNALFRHNSAHGRELARVLTNFAESTNPVTMALDVVRERGVLDKEVLTAIDSPFVFLAYARNDHERVDSIRRLLERSGCVAWLDTQDLVPGDEWEIKLREAVDRADFFIPCISHATQANKRYFHQEVDFANARRSRTSGIPFIIPLRLDDVHLDDDTARFQWQDAFPVLEKGGNDLCAAIWRQFKSRNTA